MLDELENYPDGIVVKPNEGTSGRSVFLVATEEELEQGEAREACIAMAVQAANAIGIRFASIDIARVAGSLKVLEINSGVMMEVLGKHHPDLAYATYAAALDKVFETIP